MRQSGTRPGCAPPAAGMAQWPSRSWELRQAAGALRVAGSGGASRSWWPDAPRRPRRSLPEIPQKGLDVRGRSRHCACALPDKGQQGNTRGRRLPPEVLTPAEVDTLLHACTPGEAGRRLSALIAVLYRSGLRVREARLLQVKDLDLEGSAIRVLHGKGATTRTVGIDPGGAALVRAWLEHRALKHGPRGWVFASRSGTPVSASYVRVEFARLGRRAGIGKRVHPHGLRHTLASELRAEGIDPAIIQRQLGHASLATTIRYLDHLQPTRVIEAIGGRDWLR